MPATPSPMLGLLMLETRLARPPSHIGHVQTFPFAVRRRIVAGATARRVLQQRDPALLQPSTAAAWQLVAEGCSAVSQQT